MQLVLEAKPKHFKLCVYFTSLAGQRALRWPVLLLISWFFFLSSVYFSIWGSVQTFTLPNYNTKYNVTFRY